MAKLKSINVSAESTASFSYFLLPWLHSIPKILWWMFSLFCCAKTDSPHPCNLLSPRLRMQLPCCFVIGDVHAVCSAMVQHYLCFICVTHLLATRSIMVYVRIEGGWVVKSKKFWYALDTSVTSRKYEVLCIANYPFLWDLNVDTSMFSN
jgi:hypothetical protein